ncbi:hypothetical protein [Burkholderia stagnalis]
MACSSATLCAANPAAQISGIRRHAARQRIAGAPSVCLATIAARDRSPARVGRGVAASFGHVEKLVQAAAKFNTRRVDVSRRTNRKTGGASAGFRCNEAAAPFLLVVCRYSQLRSVRLCIASIRRSAFFNLLSDEMFRLSIREKRIVN